MALLLTKLSETSSKITLGWTPVPGAIGYRYVFADGGKIPHTWDPNFRRVASLPACNNIFDKARLPVRVEALGVEAAGEYPVSAPPPPPPTGQPIPSSGRITAGGTYSGNYTGGTIVIDTPQPVVISQATITNTSGDVFRGLGGDFTIKNLTLDHCRINGGPRRVFDVEGAENITVRNCTIEGTTGMKFSGPMPGAAILVTRTRLRNLRGAPDATTSQFSQFNGVTGATIELSWNECIHDDPNTFAEDLVSIYATDGVWVHDCFFDGQWIPGNPPTSSQGGITIEAGSSNSLVEDIILVGTMGHTIYTDAGPNNTVRRVRLVRSSYLPDRVTRSQIGWLGCTSYPGSPGRAPQNGNHTHDCVVGFMNGTIHGGDRLDFLPDHFAPDCFATMKSLDPVGGVITVAHEDAERTRWQQKKQAAGVIVGAGGI
jgi:hypothetical protein